MALTITEEAIDAWAEVAQNAERLGADIDVSGHYATLIHVDMALTSAVAHTGSIIQVEISSSAADDEFWSQLTPQMGPTGTPNAEAVTNNPLAAAGTVITVASTTGYTAYGETDQLHFLEDATIANSELVRRTSHVTDTSITITDGVKREHANTAVLYNIARTYLFEVPIQALRARVIINNKYDSDGATVATRTRLVKVTAI